ncbi:hypothetical protein [Mycobacteroides abscessus]|uniref:hypothetical protein n=1 Tax=Mycobacteroides abscessus TaxID=36809 RepID=UPI000925BC42|nr:hypothetical protein [Mycobacteroides abscessus]DAZ90284.1 TPA_asm: WXG-100 motif and Tde-like DNAse [Mycobacterium phage prophiFSIL01-1]SHZ93729.1 Uncharacterised protein [Mycobacteroides abscessus subsp. abscessus]SIA06188.1 Uncharacterised protein [Mycobacteroides abscessus subsp. abscessus]SIA64231.1 Uncharacterised protein [Mycobacteroides abscessus subsp. abscessus]SIA69202.1 Uncharacterised protein [Mycobacteroides abscessus subsp. abscessus]
MSGPTKSMILGIDANSYRPLLDAVHAMATKYEQHISTFKGYVDKPGGTAWEGQTAEAGQANVADGWKVTARIQDLDTKFQTTAGMAVDHTIVPELTNCQHMIENIERQRDKGLTLSEDLEVGYNPPPGISEELAAENAKVAKARGEELKESARKWWEAEQEVKRLAEGVMRDIDNEVNGAAGTFDIGKAVKDTAPGKPDTAQNGNFYKDWYPKKTDPASIDPGAGTLGDKLEHIKNPSPTTPTAATAAADPNAPQYGPFAKDTIDKTKLGGIGESLTYINRNDKPPEEHKPSAAERFKTDISEGIDKGVDKLIAPFKDLRDRLGLGDKGFWEANEEAGKREWESFKHRMTTPPIVDIAEGVKHNIDNPGNYVGERMVDGAAILAGGPEGVLPRAGLEEAAAARLGAHPDLPSPGTLHDTPAPAAHVADPPSATTHPSPVADHPAPSVDHPGGGDHGIPANIEHAVGLPRSADDILNDSRAAHRLERDQLDWDRGEQNLHDIASHRGITVDELPRTPQYDIHHPTYTDKIAADHSAEIDRHTQMWEHGYNTQSVQQVLDNMDTPRQPTTDLRNELRQGLNDYGYADLINAGHSPADAKRLASEYAEAQFPRESGLIPQPVIHNPDGAGGGYTRAYTYGDWQVNNALGNLTKQEKDALRAFLETQPRDAIVNIRLTDGRG